MGTNENNWVGYADDIALFVLSKDTLQDALNLLNKTLDRFNLKINAKKTKSMIFNYKYLQSTNSYPASIVKLHNIDIMNVEVFRYLGSDIRYDEPTTGNAEITLRINLAEAKFQELKPKLLNFKISLTIRMLFLNAFVRSRLTYAAQTWSLNIAQANKVNSCYYKAYSGPNSRRNFEQL